MASGAIIPPIKDLMSLKAGLQSLDDSHTVNITKIFSQIPTNSRTPHSPRSISITPTTSKPERSASAQSLNSTYHTIQTRFQYNRCLEYLQQQHQHTLTQLHKEVRDLKIENKKLNFRIIVEEQGGTKALIKQTLAVDADSSNINQDILLQETIKDLKVKLDLAEDTAKHQQATIRNLNKQLKTLAKAPPQAAHPRVPHPPRDQTRRQISTEKLVSAEKTIARKDETINLLEKQIQELTYKLGEYQSIINKDPSPKFMVTNSRNSSTTNIHDKTKLPPLTSSRNKTQESSPRHGGGENNQTHAGGYSLTPRNSRTDFAERSRRINYIRRGSQDDS